MQEPALCNKESSCLKGQQCGSKTLLFSGTLLCSVSSPSPPTAWFTSVRKLPRALTAWSSASGVSWLFRLWTYLPFAPGLPLHLLPHAQSPQSDPTKLLKFPASPSKLQLQWEICCGNIKLFSFLQPAFLRLAVKSLKHLPKKNKRQRKLLLPNCCQLK